MALFSVIFCLALKNIVTFHKNVAYKIMKKKIFKSKNKKTSGSRNSSNKDPEWDSLQKRKRHNLKKNLDWLYESMKEGVQ